MPDETQVAQLLYARTDALRAQAHLPPLAPQAQLERAARAYARHMAASGRYGHEADGRTPAQRVSLHGYDYCIVLENVAHQYDAGGYAAPALADRLAQGWEQSPPHRGNLLDPDVTETGAAVARSERDGRHYAVQLFALPASRKTEFRITNRARATVRYRIEGRSYRLAPRATGTHARCRPAPVVFQWPGGQPPSEILPVSGSHYDVVRSDAGGWRVTRSP